MFCAGSWDAGLAEWSGRHFLWWQAPLQAWQVRGFYPYGNACMAGAELNAILSCFRAFWVNAVVTHTRNRAHSIS